MKVFLIDGNSFCYRAFYAIRNLATSRGQLTNAVYGFLSMMRKIIKDEKPDCLGVAFDLKGPTFRHKKYKEYKIHRKPMPDGLAAQIPVIKEIIRAYNTPIYEKQGYEADDILATIAAKLADESLDIFIVTGDKDMLQLVGPHIKIYSTHKDGLIYDRGRVLKRYGVEPGQIADLIALMGDSTDNITGVPGFGEKTAVELMKQFKSLEEILSNPDKIKQAAMRKLFIQHSDKAKLSKELATLDHDVPISVDLNDLKIKEPDSEKLFELFKRLEFRNLIKEYTPLQRLKSKYRLVKNTEEFEELYKRLSRAGTIVLDFETTGPKPMTAMPIGISFCLEEGEAYYVAFKKGAAASILPSSDTGLPAKWVFSRLRALLEDSDIKKAGQNIKYEYIILRNLGITLKGIYFDTMIASYLLNPSKLNHNLEDISMEYLHYKMTPLKELIGAGKKQISLESVDINKVSDYSCEDADCTFRLMKILDRKLKDKGLYELFMDVEMPLVKVLAEIEIAGVAVDSKFLKGMSIETEQRLDDITKEVYKTAGCEFNIKSHQQLSEVLFKKLKLPVIKRTKTGFSTDEAVLKKLASAHPIVGLILEFRMLSKLKSTYIDALPELINKKTHKIHTSFNQTVTATGRLSSSSPNLQNIPAKTELGRQIRKAFVPLNKKGIFISADYSQIELRIVAHFSKDKNLVHAFKTGRDIHTYTAARVFGVKEEDVTKKMRSQAKTVNFGIIYGMSPYGLSKDLGIDVSRAEEFIENYFRRYPDVKHFIESRIASARDKGYAVTILNRRRYIPEINSPNLKIRQFSERVAVNMPIQGSAADMIKVAMLNISNALEKEGLSSKMILQVHDELLFETKANEIKKLQKIIKREMESPFKLKVPIRVHIGEGKNWLEAEK